MIEYVTPGNIDNRILIRAAAVLSGGGLLALPSDTTWITACSFLSREGIRRLRRLSGERDERHFTLLCSDISQFGEFCSLDNSRFRVIKRLSPGPYVFILKMLVGTGKSLSLRRPELGVRIPNHPVPLAVIKAGGAPLYSITAKRSMGAGKPDEYRKNKPEDAGDETELPRIPEEDLFESGWELEGTDDLDLILDSGEDLSRIFSTILDMTGDEIRVLRRGAGPWPA
ncbi:MAG: L-threonylcarbamoyladenylate synthase [Treponema sp.]|jgi:tRNA threonylcarbamoyl adenosine modification protein (Sua5/YciO/YrdC/YwlC family)|nr:L-threonylcarbamoyladenylate synthase [Treponema sp.]